MHQPPHTKQAVERRIFEALAPLIGWGVVPGSLQQPDPPQPDILCEVVERGPLAVELVALDAPDTRLRLTNMFGTTRAWRTAMSRRSSSERQALEEDLRDAYVSIHFANDAGSRVRTTALKVMQSFLLVNPGFSGEIKAADLGDPPGFDSAKVGRGNDFSDGPHVSAPSGAYWQGPQVGKITEKLRDKSYVTTAPLELFAYSIHDEPDGAVGSLEGIQAAVAEHLPRSLFRRVHLFHAGFRRHIWSTV